LFYVTAAVALVVLISRPFWQPASEQFRAWRLSRQLREPIPSVRHDAARKLAELGPAATYWVIRTMHNANPRIRELACSIVVDTKPDRSDEALAALLEAAKDSDPVVRELALTQLERMIGRYAYSPEADVVVARAVKALREGLSDDSHRVRLKAIMGLLFARPKAHSAVSALDRALDDPNMANRIWAADALLQIDADSTRARVAAAMSTMLRDCPAGGMEHYKSVAILKSAQGAEATAAMLLPLLTDVNYQTRMAAIADLTTHCSSAKSLRSAMIELLKSDDAVMRQEAAVFLLAHEPAMARRAIEALSEWIATPSEGSHFGWAVVVRLRQTTASSAGPLAPTLLELLGSSTRPAERSFFISALGEIGTEASAGVPALLELSRGKDLEVGTRAVAALVKIDPRAAATRLPSLLEWIQPGHDSAVRLSAIASLRDLASAAAISIPALIELADEPDRAISAGAIEAVSRIDPTTGQALMQAIARREVASDDE
jgi:hypothetical protein